MNSASGSAFAKRSASFRVAGYHEAREATVRTEQLPYLDTFVCAAERGRSCRAGAIGGRRVGDAAGEDGSDISGS